MTIRKEIQEFYEQSDEKGRLSNSFIGKLERKRTLDILGRNLPPPPRIVIDVGGAAGAYAFPLAKQNYSVVLVDPVFLHIQQAQQINESLGGVLPEIKVGDARSLEVDDAFADIVLMLGPLYHLTDKNDRTKALAEAYRVLCPGGMIFCAGITRFASFMDGLARGVLRDDYYDVAKQDLTNGQHRNPLGGEFFTTAYFHHPQELLEEVEEAGFEEVELLAIEGPVWLLPEEGNLRDEIPLNRILRLLEMVESDFSLLGVSPHILAIGTKPRGKH